MIGFDAITCVSYTIEANIPTTNSLHTAFWNVDRDGVNLSARPHADANEKYQEEVTNNNKWGFIMWFEIFLWAGRNYNTGSYHYNNPAEKLQKLIG